MHSAYGGLGGVSPRPPKSFSGVAPRCGGNQFFVKNKRFPPQRGATLENGLVRGVAENLSQQFRWPNTNDNVKHAVILPGVPVTMAMAMPAEQPQQPEADVHRGGELKARPRENMVWVNMVLA